MITFYWFLCPNGHLQLITEAQKEGQLFITCEECAFHGTISNGVLKEPLISEDYMSHLKG